MLKDVRRGEDVTQIVCERHGDRRGNKVLMMTREKRVSSNSLGIEAVRPVRQGSRRYVCSIIAGGLDHGAALQRCQLCSVNVAWMMEMETTLETTC